MPIADVLGDIRSRRWLYFKAILLVVVGLLASVLLLMDSPHLRTLVLLGIAVWGFCRAYYFAFYVIQHYVDPRFRYAGLIALLRYCVGERQADRNRPS